LLRGVESEVGIGERLPTIRGLLSICGSIGPARQVLQKQVLVRRAIRPNGILKRLPRRNTRLIQPVRVHCVLNLRGLPRHRERVLNLDGLDA
jgi:hypothetical protein